MKAGKTSQPRKAWSSFPETQLANSETWRLFRMSHTSGTFDAFQVEILPGGSRTRASGRKHRSKGASKPSLQHPRANLMLSFLRFTILRNPSLLARNRLAPYRVRLHKQRCTLSRLGPSLNNKNLGVCKP